MKRRLFTRFNLVAALALGGLAVMTTLLFLCELTAPAQADPGVLYVAPGQGCGGASPCFESVQAAVDAAAPGDEIRVAAGTYTDVSARPRNDVTTAGVVIQQVYLSKTVTIRGGYTTSDWATPYPITQPTLLDAQNQGRVLYITGNVSPTLEGLRITGGNAAGLGGGWWYGLADGGGGVYVITATATLNNIQVFSNTASVGGGLYLHDSDAMLSSNTIISNTAWWGGGLFLYSSNATLSGNLVTSNTAKWGGGLSLVLSPAILNGNTISSNVADDSGGGVYLYLSDAMLSSNTITSNTAGGGGGGLYLDSSNATLNGNTIISNTTGGGGGGLYQTGGAPTLIGNTIVSNSASDNGGGLYLNSSNATLSGNTITSNTTGSGGGGLYQTGGAPTLIGNTIVSNAASGNGGGLFFFDDEAKLTNNVIADNWAGSSGGGLYVVGSGPHLLHTTIARNTGGDGSGVYVGSGGVILTNTILVSQTVGITTQYGTATMVATLWDGNTQNWGGAGIISHTLDYTGVPAFVDPDAGDYHIGAGSAAIDRGVRTDVTTDMDGDPRPAGFGFDLGADERPGAFLFLHKSAWPLALYPGQTVTYTMVITSAGINTVTNVLLTDSLPALQQSLAVATTQGSCVLGTAWAGEVTCDLGTLAPRDRVVVTLTARVTTTLPPQLPWPMHNTLWVTATEASNTTYADTVLQDCHVRLNDSPAEYSTVQAAVDSASEGDTVKVAGYCYDVNTYGGLRQQVYLSKTVTIRGGYTTTNWTTPYPITQPTLLDAQSQGRVLYITGNVSPTLEGLRITGGNAAGLGGGQYWLADGGGGAYVITATATLNNIQVFGNTAVVGGGLYLYGDHATLSGDTITSNSADDGGGLYLYCSNATLSGNTITSNAASGNGGGLLLVSSAATLSGNTVTSNTAEWGGGGGLLLVFSAPMLNGNAITSNSAHLGGGLYLSSSDATLSGNIVTSNAAGEGGGLSLYDSNATLSGNTITSNSAPYGSGGGLYLLSSDATLSGNIVASNTAGSGGGLYLHKGTAALDGNIVAANTAGAGGGLYLFESASTLDGNTIAANSAGSGGGLFLLRDQVTLINNLVADNQANSGSGLYAGGSSSRLLHTTIARNGGSGGGIYVTSSWICDEDCITRYSTLALTNTILVSHAVGIAVTVGNAATLEATLWGGGAWANGHDWGGTGAIFTGTRNYWGGPAFVDPAAGNYHIRAGSMAIDRGVNAGVTTDIDRQTRPYGAAPDLGADEYVIVGYLPLILRNG